MDLYFYKLTSDDGGAPCVADGVLTLAICKPRIRKSAGRGDWVFGFGGERLGKRLIYIAEITGKLYQGDYYRRPEFASRPDSIYEWRGPLLRIKSDARFHADGSGARKDVGKYPTYAKAYVLQSANFRYFGSNGTTTYRELFKALASQLDGLGQGERVNHSAAVRTELLALRDLIWREHKELVLGEPNDEGGCGLCEADDDDEDDEEEGARSPC